MRGRTPPLADRLAALREAVEVADDRLEVPELAQARALLAKAGAREALGDATVVALAGATGSGKSTLFNALSGSEVSTPGVRRPTTGVAHATVWGEPQDRLLDWLQVPRRHRHAPEPALDGLVLLVVLNQVDRLDAAAARACLTDLRALLDREGLADTPLLAVSARTGTGIGELRADLARRVSARRAATDRLTADVRTTAATLAAHCAAGPPAHPDGGPGVGRAEHEQLTDALAEAAGVPAVTAAVERSVRRSGTATTGWPVVRWTRRLRPDPLERLHLAQDSARVGRAQDAGDGAAVARTSLPPAGAVQRAGVTRAVRAAREAAGDGLPQAWRDELRRTVEVSEERLADRLDRAVAGTDLGSERTPLWQRGVGGLQWLLTLVALAGALWLLALVALGFFQLDDVVPLPRVEGIPLPTLLLVGGLLAGALLALVARPLVGLRARRRARRAEQRLYAAVDVVAQEEVLTPMAEVREDHERYCAAVTRAGR